MTILLGLLGGLLLGAVLWRLGRRAQPRAPRSFRRRLLTPEGVELDLEIAPALSRFAALATDAALLGLLVIALVAVAFASGVAERFGNAGPAMIVMMLGVFFLRYFWFIGFESGPRAATPGKRLFALRVVARDGGTLDFGAVVARNLIRDLEMLLPVSIAASASGLGWMDGTRWIGAVALSLVFSCALLFNRDRMRIGDIVAGTWVVVDHRRSIARDLVDDQTARDAQALAFTPDELSVYGVFELQRLEQVLRRRDVREEREASDAIRRRLGRPMVGDDRTFLEGYYHAARAHMERELLFGEARADKHARRKNRVPESAR